MSVTYEPAPSVETIGRKLIGKHHTDLADVEVKFIFRSEAAERHGQAVWGKARKVSGLNAFLYHQAAASAVGADPLPGEDSVEAFFVIEIARDIWTILTGLQREALVDHELSHCRTKLNKDGEVVLFVAPHDLEEFNHVVERHGLWRKNTEAFIRSLRRSGQLTLDLLDELEEPEEGNETVASSAPAPELEGASA